MGYPRDGQWSASDANDDCHFYVKRESGDG